ncbi:MAG TPA: hypothetical protein VMB73_14030 [Acetobacteraceae bacterium]|nr:hypothetical protein [Acetobacteraceae bacterium]
MQQCHVAIAADKFAQAAAQCDLHVSPEQADPGHLVRSHRFADTLQHHWRQNAQIEIAFGQFRSQTANRDRTRRSSGLQPRRQVHRVADAVVFQPPARVESTHDRLAGVDADPDLDRALALLDKPIAKGTQGGLHREARMDRTARMILIGGGRAEQGQDAIARGLNHIAFIGLHGVDHQAQRRVDDGARLLGIEFHHQFDGSFDVREQHADQLALAFEHRVRRRPIVVDRYCRMGMKGCGLLWRTLEPCRALAAESRHCRILGMAARAYPVQGAAAFGAEASPAVDLRPANMTPHRLCRLVCVTFRYGKFSHCGNPCGRRPVTERSTDACLNRRHLRQPSVSVTRVTNAQSPRCCFASQFASRYTQPRDSSRRRGALQDSATSSWNRQDLRQQIVARRLVSSNK